MALAHPGCLPPILFPQSSLELDGMALVLAPTQAWGEAGTQSGGLSPDLGLCSVRQEMEETRLPPG